MGNCDRVLVNDRERVVPWGGWPPWIKTERLQIKFLKSYQIYTASFTDLNMVWCVVVGQVSYGHERTSIITIAGVENTREKKGKNESTL